MKTEVLGVDVGGVIITRENVVAGVSFLGPNYLDAKPIAGAFSSIDRLVQERFGDDVHLVVAGDPLAEQRTKAWLALHGFYARASVSIENIHFCKTREEKASKCVELGITHLVDDRMEVMQALGKLQEAMLASGKLQRETTRILFNPHEDELKLYQNPTYPVSLVHTWKEITDMLLPSHSFTPSP